MTALYYATVFVHVVVCLFLIIVVLLQSGKGSDIAAAFSGQGSQTAFGPRGAATALSRAGSDGVTAGAEIVVPGRKGSDIVDAARSGSATGASQVSFCLGSSVLKEPRLRGSFPCGLFVRSSAVG
jgi:protein translocase SecG subunit